MGSDGRSKKGEMQPFDRPLPTEELSTQELKEAFHATRVRDALCVPLLDRYADQTPYRFVLDQSQQPLDAVDVYFSEAEPCFHYVGWGMSEVGEKRSVNDEISGWGFELMFRLATTRDQRRGHPKRLDGTLADNAPSWPVDLLVSLCQLVEKTRRGFCADDFVEIADWAYGSRRAALLRAEGEPLHTPNGQMRFLLVEVISAEQLLLLKRAYSDDLSYRQLLKAIRYRLPPASADYRA